MPLLKPNTIFARRYRLVKHLGTGAFAEVWKAEDTLASNTVIAIKIYAPEKGMDQDGLKIFRDEYALPYSLKHTHLLTAKHFDVYNGSPYLVMNYCEEGSLMRRLVHKHPFTENELANILKQIGNALDYVHKNQLCHKDIKPENILIENQDMYVLADFGISSRIRRTIMQNMAADKHQARYVAFTPPFAPPESHTSPPAPSGDIFSLGATMYELAAGKLPFEQMGRAVSEGAFIPKLPAQFSDDFYQVLLACMRLNPKERPSANELSEAANHYLKKGQWLLGNMTDTHITASITLDNTDALHDKNTEELNRPDPNSFAPQKASSHSSFLWLLPILGILLAVLFWWFQSSNTSEQWTQEHLFPADHSPSIPLIHQTNLLDYINTRKVPKDWVWELDSSKWQVLQFGLNQEISSMAAFLKHQTLDKKELVIISQKEGDNFKVEMIKNCQNCTSMQLIDKGASVNIKDKDDNERVHRATYQEIKVSRADQTYRLFFQEDGKIRHWDW